jgi:uracil-DNA glycosylase family 4
MAGEAEQQLRAYVDYLRDMGIHDFYRRGEPVFAEVADGPVTSVAEVAVVSEARSLPVKAASVVEERRAVSVASRPEYLEPPIAKLVSFDDLAPLPESRMAAAHKAEALVAIQKEIGDCTRCPLAYAGRRTIVFGDGDANARLMFVGEGPGADEDALGVPFVGKAGQLLNNMIQAMGLKREEVYIANIVKCRPPANRVPEPVEANTCDQFLLQQIDVVQPQVVVALGATAAMYLLGVKQSLSALRGRWHSCRGAKLAVTYHPAFLLRDPRQKSEAWKDLQMVMAEMGLKVAGKG